MSVTPRPAIRATTARGQRPSEEASTMCDRCEKDAVAVQLWDGTELCTECHEGEPPRGCGGMRL